MYILILVPHDSSPSNGILKPRHVAMAYKFSMTEMKMAVLLCDSSNERFALVMRSLFVLNTYITISSARYHMKKKLHISFLGLGILAMIVSHLFVLAPAPKAYAATLDLDTIKNETYKFSVYAAWHSCLNSFDTNVTVASDLSMDVNYTHFIGFAGTGDGNNNDGQVSCAEAGKLWMTVAGYSDVGTMMKDLGFSAVAGTCPPPNYSGCTPSDVFSAKGTSRSAILDKHSSVAKSKGIPTSVPTWGRYMLAISALQAKCQPRTIQGGMGPSQTTPSKSVTYVSDNVGNTSSANFTYETDNGIAAWPGPTGGNNSSCSYLIGVVQDPKAGTTALATAMANSRIDSTISTAKTAVCDSLNLESQKAKDNCQVDFGNYLKTCIDSYYAGNAHASAISRTEAFDATVVSTCVENLAKKDGYDITAENIAGFLTSAQDANTPAESDTSTTNDDPCSVLAAEIQMRWLACALLTTGAGIAEMFYGIIQNLLYTPVAETFKSIDTPFKTFRLLGMGLIVIVGLIMIIAQATGSDLVDAYTVKKVLPKLGVALVGIALALPLLRFAIELTNNIGFLIGDFIANVGGAQNLVIPASGSDGVGAALIGLAGLAGGVVAAYVYGLSVISFVLIIAIGLLVGVVTLALRQTAIVVLVLLAPLAIASYVLPGTDKLWKFWKNTLLTTLVMFPIIMLFIKSGVLMAGIFGSKGDGFSTLMAVLVYFAPYFMIPMAFKMAGGLMGNVFGMLNDRMKGAYNGLRSWRSNTRKRRVADYVSGAKHGPSIFGKDLIGGAITRAATTYEGGLSMSKAGRGRYNEFLSQARRSSGVEGAKKDDNTSLGDTDATAVAETATSRKDFVNRYVGNYVDAKQKAAKKEGRELTEEEIAGHTKTATANAYRTMAAMEGSLGTTMGSKRMQNAAHYARTTGDNTIDFIDDENKPDIEAFWGSIAQQVDMGNITDGDAITESGANKMRADLGTAMSTGQRKQAIAWMQESAARGDGYTFTDDQKKQIAIWTGAGTSASAAVHGNPRNSKAVAENMDTAIRSALHGGEIMAMTPEELNTKEKKIQEMTATNLSTASARGESVSEETARREAEQQYQVQMVQQQLAKVLNIQDNLGQGIPEVQSILSQNLLGKQVDVSGMDDQLAKHLGITEEERSGKKTITHLELADRNRASLQTLRHDYVSGDQELAAHAARENPGITPPTPGIT